MTLPFPPIKSVPMLHLELNQAEAKEMLWLLNRAVNTLEPADWPKWLSEYFDHLEGFGAKNETP